MSGSFNLFPWDRAFLPLLKDFATACAKGAALSELTIVFPHNRPRRYLMELYRQDAVAGGKTLILPRIITISELFDLLLREKGVGRHAAGMPDLVVLLHKIVTSGLGRGDLAGLSELGKMDLDAFLPWGVQLANLFEECFYQLVTPDNINHAQDLPETAVALLGGLGDIYAAYRQALEKEGWITQGIKASMAAAVSGEPPDSLPPGERIFLAGFVTLAGSEEAVLRGLWERGAHVCLHTDAAGFMLSRPHWSCRAHSLWMELWGAGMEMPYAPSGRKPELFYFSGHDLHSQLAELPQLLGEEQPGAARSTVIALSRDDLLMPTLHALPRKDVNISLGYPLERSPLCRLVESILRLHESRREDGRFHWRIAREVMRHPYLHMLEVRGADDGAEVRDGAGERLGGPRESLRPFFYRVERKLRAGQRFVRPMELFEAARKNLSQTADPVVERLFICIFGYFATDGAFGTLHRLGSALEELCAILLEHGGDIWRRFPIDAECFRRLKLGVIPLLKDSLMAGSPLSRTAVHNMLREAVKAERVPFEAEPIAGVQVLGMLETRLLHFEKVILLDAVDSALPGRAAQSALLPDSLRPAVGLPSTHSRELASAHTLHRLLAGAEKAHILWQEGEAPLSDGRTERSRFVEELIWREEKKQKRIFKNGEAPLMTRTLPVRPFGARRPRLERTPALDAAIGRIMSRPMPPTMLDAYLSCPARFIYSYALKIKPRQEVNEGDDPLEVGDLLHKALYESYLPFKGREIKAGDITGEGIAEIFSDKMREAGLLENLPAESAIMLQLAAPWRLERFLSNQPPGIRIKALEHTLNAGIKCAAGQYAVFGKLDRLDERCGGLYVLDYKTGRGLVPAKGIWTDNAFWHGVETAAPDDSGALRDLGSALNSLQLPCYIFLTGQSEFGLAKDAIFVELRDEGEEIFLFGEDMDDNERKAAITGRIPAAFSLVLGHMALAGEFPAVEGKKCEWCEYNRICS